MILILAGAYLIILTAMYVYQDQLLYNPDRSRTPPGDVGLTMAQEIKFASSDGTALIAWYTPPEPNHPTILFFHGKGGALKNRPNRYQHYVSHGFGVFFLSYRGYGGSAGRPTEKGIIEDAEAAYQWLRKRGAKPGQIVVVGESLGSGVAVQLASRQSVAAVALEAPYSSVADVAAQRFWWIPVQLLIRDRFDSMSRIGSIHAPLLIQHGDADTQIPIAFGKLLFNRANIPKQFIALKDKGHFIFTAEIFDRELDFFRQALNLQ